MRLPRLIGLYSAVPLILSGAVIGAPKARKLGIVDLLLDQDTSIYVEDEGYFLNQIERYAHCDARPCDSDLRQFVLLSSISGLLFLPSAKPKTHKGSGSLP